MPETTTTAKASSSTQRLKSGLAQLVWRVNERLEWFKGSAEQPETAPKRRCACVVLARGLYQENWQSFNIRSYKALRKILKQKAQPRQLFYIGPWQDSQRQVLTITLSEQAQPLLLKAWLVFPESLVVSAAVSPGLYEVNSSQQSYFLFKTEQRWQTLLRSKLVNDATKAKLALGCSEQTAAQPLSQGQVSALCARGVAQVGSLYWQQALQQPQSGQQRQLPWQQLGVSLAVVAALYLALSSGYLLLKQTWVTQRLAEVTPQVSELLTAQNQFQQATSSLDELQRSFVDDERINNFWRMVAALPDDSVSLTYMTLTDSKLVIGGTAIDALQLLKDLHALPQVEKAEFASPVRDNRGVQQFRIDVVLKAGGATS
ncbi:hypothetical protein CWI80_04250 [Pseudidiomarina sediminum]|uniref:Uncharacterized protein n=1 Tax=Pseudidiomarina sediminum TaxID=431675 RepID=A0A432Z9I7_9GAMM|nr:hypothetical protein [Pseudidiomarina sediminum]RUO74559.1 hypothetical protein CWI80_04250 [Pseudidiomarina sediminum]